MVPGGLASMLGAAITGGMGEFRQQKLDAQKAQEVASQLASQKLQQQMLMEELANAPQRREEAAQRLASGKILQQQGLANLALTNDKVNELPQVHAEGDVTRAKALLGDDWLNNPSAVAKAKLAGLDLPTQNVQLARVQGIESGSGGPVPTTQQQASTMGVAPDTGVVLPASVRLNQKNQERAGAVDDLNLQALRSAMGGASGQPGGFEMGADNIPKDTPHNRQLGGMLGANDPIVKIYGPAATSVPNAVAKAQAEQEVKAQVPPAMLQRVTGGMNEMITNLTTAQKELEKLYPGIEKSVVMQKGPDGKEIDTGTGQYNGLMDTLGAVAHRNAYNFKYTPYNKAIQAASLGNLEGWANAVPGRINPSIIKKLQEHQSGYGNWESPLASYQRNLELIEMTKKNLNDLRAGGQPQPMPTAVAPPTTAAPSAPAPPVEIQGNPFPTQPQSQLKSGDTIPFAEVAARAKKANLDPNQFAAQLIGAGVKVTKP